MEPRRPFDAHYELLSIPPSEQPPNLYRLLGINRFETNKEVITNAAYRHMTFLRRMSGGEFAEHVEKLLNEVADAKLCLLDPKRRAEYDTALQAEMRPPPSPAAIDHAIDRALPSPGATSEATTATSDSQRGESTSPSPNRLPDKTWIVGSSPRCDLIQLGSGVSRSHCQLTRRKGQILIEDLGSANGTYVNNRQLARRTPIESTDLVTLGRRVRLEIDPAIWPSGAGRAYFIGRNPANEVIVEDATVSEFHARVIKTGRNYLLEDLESSNGTRVVGRVLSGRQTLQAEQLVTFGDHSLLAAELMERIERS